MRKILILATVWATCGCALASDSPKADGTEAWIRFVAAELRELRRELLYDRIERQQERVRRLEHELQQADSELQNGEEAQRAQAQEINQLDRSLGDPNLPSEERSQLEATRVAAVSEDQSYRASLTRKVTDIGEALRRERGRLDSLLSSARAIALPQPGTAQ